MAFSETSEKYLKKYLATERVDMYFKEQFSEKMGKFGLFTNLIFIVKRSFCLHGRVCFVSLVAHHLQWGACTEKGVTV